MVPNKICRSQDFGDAGYLLTIIAKQDFMGMGTRTSRPGTRSRGARTEPSTGTVWVRPGCAAGRVPG